MTEHRSGVAAPLPNEAKSTRVVAVRVIRRGIGCAAGGLVGWVESPRPTIFSTAGEPRRLDPPYTNTQGRIALGRQTNPILSRRRTEPFLSRRQTKPIPHGRQTNPSS